VTWTARAFVFSGRPDPTWDLPAAEGERLADLFAGLAPAAAGERATPGDRLGYRGVYVRVDDGRRWIAAGGLVTFDDGTGEDSRTDPGQTFERLVVATAGDVLPPGVGPAQPG